MSVSIYGDCSVYLLAGVCGDSQAVGHKACCFVLLHQPHRNNRDSHLKKMKKTHGVIVIRRQTCKQKDEKTTPL